MVLKFHITVLPNLKMTHSKIERELDAVKFRNSHIEKASHRHNEWTKCWSAATINCRSDCKAIFR